MTNAVSRIVIALALAPAGARRRLFRRLVGVRAGRVRRGRRPARVLADGAPAPAARAGGLHRRRSSGSSARSSAGRVGCSAGFWSPSRSRSALKAISEARQAATIAIGGTALGALWIGGGLGALILIRALPDHGRLALIVGGARRLGRRHVRVSRRAPARPPQDGARDVAREDVGGLHLRDRRDGLRRVRRVLQGDTT